MMECTVGECGMLKGDLESQNEPGENNTEWFFLILGLFIGAVIGVLHWGLSLEIFVGVFH